jgi:uncharacterized damage-inducible protein DinB
MAKTQTETLFLQRWEQVSKKLEQLADALPEEKLEWRPAPAVRTCGDALRHVAFWNQYLADSLRGKDADDTLNELPAADYPTKASVLKALRQSAADVTTALKEKGTAPDAKSTEMVMSFLEHTLEHYGQLIVYRRLLDVVPPAWRG